MLISNKMRLKGEVRADNKELIDDILLYYRKSLNDENRGILRQIIEDFIIDPKNIPHDIDRFKFFVLFFLMLQKCKCDY